MSSMTSTVASSHHTARGEVFSSIADMVFGRCGFAMVIGLVWRR